MTRTTAEINDRIAADCGAAIADLLMACEAELTRLGIPHADLDVLEMQDAIAAAGGRVPE